MQVQIEVDTKIKKLTFISLYIPTNGLGRMETLLSILCSWSFCDEKFHDFRFMTLIIDN